jgi:L-aminopeptidase/D-esterase-like protein
MSRISSGGHELLPKRLPTRALVASACAAIVAVVALAALNAQPVVRARGLGIPFDGTPRPLNAITDVAGVEVGMTTLIRGDGPLVMGKGPVRTGVTAILPRGRRYDPVFAGWYTLNGNGEMTGTTWITEAGFLETPILITNTFSVGIVRDAAVQWMQRNHYFDAFSPRLGDLWYAYPLVAETYDGLLNDISGQHVQVADALTALDSARSGPVQEGSVGGGTGMICHLFKCGTGTASRRATVAGATYTVGVVVQANHGNRGGLTIAGVPGRTRQGNRLDHRHRCHRCAAARASTRATRSPCPAGDWPCRRTGRQRLRRYLPGFFNGQRRGREADGCAGFENAGQR